MVKLAIGSIGDSLSGASVKSYLAEFIATLLFVFAGVGSAIAYGMFGFLLFFTHILKQTRETCIIKLVLAVLT